MNAEVAAVLADVERQRAALASATGALRDLRGRATSPDGLCAAEVDLSGALVALWLDESVTTRPPREVGALVAATAASAAAAAGQRRAEVLAAVVGALTAHTG